MKYEIVMRTIDEDGAVQEERRFAMKDGELPDRALVLGETETQSALYLVGCDESDACMMMMKNNRARFYAKLVTFGKLICGALSEDEHEDESEDDADEIADGIRQTFSPD